jgi:hypothetical protein
MEAPGLPSQNNSGDSPVSEWRVLVLITEALKDYEREVVAPRHRETTQQLAKIANALTEEKGIKKFAAWVIPLVIAVLSLAAEIMRHR